MSIRHKKMPITIKIMIEVVIIAFAAVIVVSFLAFWMSVKPPKWPVNRTPADYGMDFEKIIFQSTDGINLLGWYVPAKQNSDKTIIMMHGYPASKSDIVDLGVFLHNEYNLFFFDFRYMGESEGKYTTAGALEVNDLLGAIEYLKKEKPVSSKKIGTWGFSLGGAVGLMALDRSDDIKAVVADSAYAELNLMIDSLYSRFGFLKAPFVFSTSVWARLILGLNTKDVSPLNSVAKSNIPILLIHGELDKEILPKNSIMIYDRAVGEKEFWLIQGVGHGAAYFARQSEYEQRVMDFFKKFLK